MAARQLSITWVQPVESMRSGNAITNSRRDASQAQLFEAWFEDALKSGSEWFDCPLKTPEGGIQNYAARFTDIYQGPALVGKSHWRFTAELELRERPILSPGWGNFPGFIAQQSIIDIALNREWPEA